MGLEKIEEYKRKLGMTTAELALKSGVPKGTLDKILSGATKDPKLETLKAIARVLGLTLDDFDDYEPDETEVFNGADDTYEHIEELIARNGKDLTAEKRMKLIKLLSELE